MSLSVEGRKWLFITSPRNFDVCLKYSVFGVDERYEVTATQLLSVGDKVFFYVTRRRVFIGPWEIVQRGRYEEKHPAVHEWIPPGKYRVIIRLKRLLDKLLEVPITSVFNELLFITNRKEYSDHFQFSIVSIRDEDYDLLYNIGEGRIYFHDHRLSDKDIKELIIENGKFGVLQLLQEVSKRRGLYLEEEVRGNRAYAVIRNPRNGREVRISLKESGYKGEKSYEDQCWVGISWGDFRRLAERPSNSFIILADCINGNYVVIPFNAIRWRSYSGGKSFTVFITPNNEYIVNSADPRRGVRVKKNTLEDILKVLWGS